MSPPYRVAGLSAAVARARALATGGRRILGIAGPPGAGKSTLARAVVAALGERAVCVPMDGFHLAQVELARLGAAARKGAPDTFDASGYAALLRRLRSNTEKCVYAPAFRRDLEEPIAGAIPVPRSVPLVVTEGNYLLLSDASWVGVGELLDETWYVCLDDETRLHRLVARHAASGKSNAAAREWAYGSDERNAALVAATRARADVLVSGLDL
ncbi:MAG: nucleoside/nucleotide kinase family protein [Micromonosporaceae bacterium]